MEKTISINNKDYQLKFGFKAMLLFEKITARPFKGNSTEDIIVGLHSALLSYNDNFKIGLEEFCGVLDKQPELVADFMEILGIISDKVDLVTDTTATTTEEPNEEEKKN